MYFGMCDEINCNQTKDAFFSGHCLKQETALVIVQLTRYF